MFDLVVELDQEQKDQGVALHRLGTVLRTAGKLEESERALREALALLRANHPEGHPEVATARAQAPSRSS